MNATTTSKAHQAIRRYLEMKDFEVIEESWAHGQDSIDFIARDGDALAFIATQVNENAGEGFPEIDPEQKDFDVLFFLEGGSEANLEGAALVVSDDGVEQSVALETISREKPLPEGFSSKDSE